MAATTIPIELAARRLRVVLSCLSALCCVGCSGDLHEDDHAPHAQGKSWSVTAWGNIYEVFPEIDALVAGETAAAHTHVTVLDGFSPLASGRVEIVLAGDSEETFAADEPARPGIFNIELRPQTPGEYDLSIRIDSAAGTETLRGGRVRVGPAESPGGVVRAPAPRGSSGAGDGGQPISFLKEQQWQVPFATLWVRSSTFARALEGLATVRPVAGGDAWITAPVNGLVATEPWPFEGQRRAAGDPVFRLVPSVSPGRSLAELKADLATARQQLDAAERRAARLKELMDVEATSARELDEARTREGVWRARFEAAEDDLSSAHAARQGRGGGDALWIRAPFAGRIAAVEATPGSAVAAGDRLARLVRTDVVWLSIALPPRAAAQIAAGLSGVVLSGTGEDSSSLDGEAVRLVSVAPSVDPQTGKLHVLIEISGNEGVPLGSTWPAQVLLAEQQEGIVVPKAALVDDGGQTVVYLQLGGERFVRQPIEVVSRQGERVLVRGLVPGQRLVSRGGDAIRRSTLMSSGAGHGHVH